MVTARPLSLVLLALASSCSFPKFIARQTLTDSYPIGAASKLHCRTHNGDVTVIGKAGLTEIRMRAELSVRGHTQHEADANLQLLAIRHEEDGDRFLLTSDFDRSRLKNMSPSFTFVLETPPGLALQIESHNGDIRTASTAGAVYCTTHNGDISTRAAANRVELLSHNGDVDASIEANGPLNGMLTSHNGDIGFDLAGNPGTRVTAETHNGRTRLERRVQGASISKRRLDFQLGGGDGRIKLVTHNGDVVVR